MYNHYIPESNGVYKRHSVIIPDCPQNHEQDCFTETASTKHACDKPQKTPGNRCSWDLGDLLLICIVLIILLDSDEDEKFPILIAAAAFMFLQ